MAKKQMMTPEDLLKFQYISDPQVSPDGRRALFVKKEVDSNGQYATNLWQVGATTGQPRQFTSGGKDSHPRWSPDGTRVAFIRRADDAGDQIYTIDALGGEALPLTRLPEGALSTFTWSPDCTSVAVCFREHDAAWTHDAVKKRKEAKESDPPRIADTLWYRLDGSGYFLDKRDALLLVDTATGRHRQVYAKDAMGLFTFDFSPDSRQIVIATNRDKQAVIRPWKAELLRYDIKARKLHKIPDLPEGFKSAVRWSPDGKSIAYAGLLGKETTWGVENVQLFVCDPVRGGAKSLTGDTDYCLVGIVVDDSAEVHLDANIQWSSDSKRLFMEIGWHGEQHVASVATTGGSVTFHTKGKVRYGMGNMSGNGKVMAMMRSTADAMAEVFVGRVRQRTFDIQARTHCNKPLLKGKKLATMRQHWITSTDGVKVHVWVLEPPGRPKRRRGPAVLQVHGGPHAQYGVGFFHEMQVLAAAGYTVFFSNPRGSKGYGHDHCAPIKGQWGGKDWEDIQAVTSFMQQYPGVDPKRMGIMGGSYGGYMANWAIGHTDAFAGAITDRSVSNLVSFFGNTDFPTEPDRYWQGNSWDRPDALWEQSPVKYLGNAKTPTLIIHSEGDLRCNVEQAEQVFTILQLRGVPSRLVRYPATTSHGMSRQGPPTLRIHRLQQILAWWQQHL